MKETNFNFKNYRGDNWYISENKVIFYEFS
ncbi:hypothetical protein Pint_21399 [Pistacia integerrima]|uniref:Uncharacterized protein n=1 Tax=Pistacia integerrima TaxID=434235 RepID=A0ACC0XBX5_9ROSI|nr:hypothetical protein Pint_21399 [Pistacia integerrima]